MLLQSFALMLSTLPLAAPPPPANRPTDWRNLEAGLVIPDEGYCDQPYVVVLPDKTWLCVMTTGRGIEGNKGQHIVSTTTRDQGRTWSPLVDIEPADGPEASWALPLLTPSGRVYVFYTYNSDRIDYVGNKKGVRVDMLGHLVYKYSDDGGRTWSPKRWRIPVRQTPYDDENDYQGKVQMLWGVGDPIVIGGDAWFCFSKISKYLVEKTEGWMMRSDNILTEPDPDQHHWQMLPEGDVGLRAVRGPISEEHFVVPLDDGNLYAVGRTIDGYIGGYTSRDGGKSWTAPAYATYRPGGRPIKSSRACPRMWQAKNGKYLLWYHNHSTTSFMGRNPVYLSGGVSRGGQMYWSQPEIVLYSDVVEDRMSYPDLIEQDGQYWITETNKSVARVHAIPPHFLEGLWSQAESKTVVGGKGLVASYDAAKLAASNASVAMPMLPQALHRGGFTFDLWVKSDGKLESPAPLLDSRRADGVGVRLQATPGGGLTLDLSDGSYRVGWDSQDGLLSKEGLHHIVVIVDGEARIISAVVDGEYVDGGESRVRGWSRVPAALGDVRGAAEAKVHLNSPVRVTNLRIYNRYLRTSEALSNYHAGPEAQPTP